jgi:hypothetical protein
MSYVGNIPSSNIDGPTWQQFADGGEPGAVTTSMTGIWADGFAQIQPQDTTYNSASRSGTFSVLNTAYRFGGSEYSANTALLVHFRTTISTYNSVSPGYKRADFFAVGPNSYYGEAVNVWQNQHGGRCILKVYGVLSTFTWSTATWGNMPDYTTISVGCPEYEPLLAKTRARSYTSIGSPHHHGHATMYKWPKKSVYGLLFHMERPSMPRSAQSLTSRYKFTVDYTAPGCLYQGMFCLFGQ